MSSDSDFTTGEPSPDMAQYLQMYLDETAEQVEALVESLLVLEARPADVEQLNESFRLIHSIKGSSALMGLEVITVLTHHLENHFEQLRSGKQVLDQKSMALILRCVDYLRHGNERLRAGETVSAAPELLVELDALSARVPAPTPDARADSSVSDVRGAPIVVSEATAPVTRDVAAELSDMRAFRLLVQFEVGLQLADLKAELVLTRLSGIATVRRSRPDRPDLSPVSETHQLEVWLDSSRSPAELRSAADVDGVELIEVDDSHDELADSFSVAGLAAEIGESPSQPKSAAGPEILDGADRLAATQTMIAARDGDDRDAKSKPAETVRVDIARLDNLMNLAGELVVNRARFVQVARKLSPAFKKSNLGARVRGFGESMRRAIEAMKVKTRGGDETSALSSEQVRHLEMELQVLEEQGRLWEEGRKGFGQLIEAIDQMARMSDSLQRGVLETRMVPVAPLFNRFKRVVRDISLELGKRVRLEVSGEQTELDKRMIDELGDPLVHLVRNAIDHGIEPTDVRKRRGKPETGTISLGALHSGNNVYITVRDDGGGISVDKVKQRIAERGLLPADGIARLSDTEAIEFIWHPGFSTADAVSDISGRGVGMDIVKTRITELNGVVEVQSTPGQGTTFSVRLPLTLAIIRSLMFGVRYGTFAVPIDNVREIVSVPADKVLTVHGRQTFDIRGTFIPLVSIDDLFDWNGGTTVDCDAPPEPDRSSIQAVILHSADQSVGLRVDELYGGQEIVIKSLAENFTHIRGLSGASILGDGSVCLLLDAAAAIAMAADPRRHRQVPRVTAAL